VVDTHREFARFLTFSQRSLNEVRDAIRGAMLKEYINRDEDAAIEHLAVRLRPSLSRFIAYLRQTPDVKNRPDTTRRHRQRTRKGKPTSARGQQRADAPRAEGEPRTREAKPSPRTRERSRAPGPLHPPHPSRDYARNVIEHALALRAAYA